MSSPETISNLDNVSSLLGHDNNDIDGNTETCTSTSQTESTASESDLPAKKKDAKKSPFAITMFNLINLMIEFVIMILAAMTYAAITNDHPKIGRSPAAYNFFTEDSHITDWYRGEISKALNQARSSDIAFVMFYAPWDAESQRARKQFQITASHMHEEVSFAAVNCWQPGSECKTQYSKVYKWPVLIAYPTHGRGVQYNGPLMAPYMIRFLKNMKFPLKRLITDGDIEEHLAKHDAVIVGLVDALPTSLDYAVFYTLSLRILEKDPFQEVGVAVNTQLEFDDHGQLNHPQLFIYMWNETLIYPSSEEWKVESLLTWIFKHLHQVTNWVSPSGTKSMSLSNFLQPGPTLILFTPKNPLLEHNDYYTMLKEVAYEYYNCDQNEMISMRQKIIHNRRYANYLKHLELIQRCAMHNFTPRNELIPNNIWSNNSECRTKQMLLSRGSMMATPNVVHSSTDNNFCIEYVFEKEDSPKCDNLNNIYRTSKISDFTDYKSPKSLMATSQRETCKLFQIAQKFEPLYFSNELYSENNSTVKGLSCKSNRSLTFISMDSLQHYHYAEKLGIDLKNREDKSAVVILSDKTESHFIMDGMVNEINLRKFISNFMQNSIARALKSITSVKSKNTHFYLNNQNCDQRDAKFCVTELFAHDFLRTIMQPNKAVIIFYYTKQCSFCNGISYRFLTVAKSFSLVEELLFSRIDGDLNLLPWEYTMDVYPTILFVPPNKKAESRVFPMGLPITIPNLVGFILANLESPLKLEAMWSLCLQAKFSRDVTSCTSSLRIQTLSVIGRVLQEWRIGSSRQKVELFRKLQHLRHLHLLLAHSPQKKKEIQYHFNRLKFIDSYGDDTGYSLKKVV